MNETATGSSGELKALLGVYGLTYSYSPPGKGIPILDSVSFELNRGEILALLGPNGSGKSTLLKAAAGILPLSPHGSGVVRHRSVEFLGLPPVERAAIVSYVPPDIRAEFPLSAYETVLMGRSCRGPKRAEDHRAIQEAMELCLCWSWRDQDLHTLSGGERQLVALARAFVQQSHVLFLDEALSRMDLNHQAAMGRVLVQLAENGRAIVLVSHDVNLASEWAHTALLLKAGKSVAYGPVGEVLTEKNILRLYPDSSLHVVPSPTTGKPKVFFGP